MAAEKRMSPKDEQQFLDLVKEIVEHPKYTKLKEYIQHGETTVYEHSLAVAYLSYWIALKYGWQVQLKELVRGALLHDYFLYDWHEKSADHRFHGFTHPGRALRNACAEFDLTQIEKDVIRKHMFPLTPIPPRYRETAIVCMADKICSIYETFHMTLFGELYPAS